jgi:MOSC domain-containing protein YiiM
MKPTPLPGTGPTLEADSFLACLASVIELRSAALPALSADEDPATGWGVSRWLGSLGLGLARIADPATFSWAGPWIARVAPPLEHGEPRFVVMFGVPSGVIWDPAGGAEELDNAWLTHGFVIAAGDIALARPARPPAAETAGTLERIWVAESAGQPARSLEQVRALPGRGLEGDRHVTGRGTFPSGPSGSALTLIEAEVCESFSPPLSPDEHRRNLVTRGIPLGRLVGHEFTIGAVRCRGMRLCEPCTVVQGYAGRPVLRALVHRGGLRADILAEGVIAVGDPVRAAGDPIRASGDPAQAAGDPAQAAGER